MLFELENVQLMKREKSGFRLIIEKLDISAGRHVALTGPSGCGKSTALDMLGMILAPDAAATFTFTPEDVTVDIPLLWGTGKLDAMALLRRRFMGYILQTGELLPFLSVADNIAMPASLLGLSRKVVKERTETLAERLDIRPLLRKYPAEISIGERQRAAIARALSSSPKVVLADEPTASLDPERASDVMELLLETAGSCGTTVILVSHDKPLVKRFDLTEIPVTVKEGVDGIVTAVIRGEAR